MAAVDYFWLMKDCEDCAQNWDVEQYRLLTIPISESQTQTTEGTIISRMAEDLGVPCPHRNTNTFHKHRWWGLIYCAAPCHNGASGLAGPIGYSERDSAQIRAKAKANPNLAAEFRQRVLIAHDREFAFQLFDDIRKTR
jgi:hypothetical protein